MARTSVLEPSRAAGRWRLVGIAVAFLLLWPAWSVLFGSEVLFSAFLFNGVPRGAARAAIVASAWHLRYELLAVGALLTLAATAASILARGRGAAGRAPRVEVLSGVLEAAVVALSLLLGIALELPSALHHPAFRLVDGAPVWAATAGLAVIVAAGASALGALERSRARALRHVAAAAVFVLLGWGAVRFPPIEAPDAAGSDVRVVLGLDSLSLNKARLGELKAFTDANGGTWYEAAVTPGLLTNAVWPAILTSRRPSEIGVFFIYQAPDWTRLPSNLVTRARAAGLTTHGFFSDQFTLHVGSDLPFDEDRSGPRGWLQVTTAALKDAGWFLPAILPHLPRLPGAGSPRNQAGTYASSLRGELADILSAGGGPRGALVLGHLDYLHQGRYPGYSELAPDERARVRRAPLRAVVDHSIHWQYPVTGEDPINLYPWKIRHLQQAVVAAVQHSGFLDPARRNQLVLFSDHGPRIGVEAERFGDPRYFNVPLMTFGLPPRDPKTPLSLMELPALVGLPPPEGAGRTEPLVEYVNVTAREWSELLRTSKPFLDGGLELPRPMLERLGGRLLAFRPFSEPRGYSPAPAVPAPERRVPEGIRAFASSQAAPAAIPAEHQP